MQAQHALEVFKQSSELLEPEVQGVLSNPAERQKLYKLLIGEPLQPLALLIRAAFQKEVEYRNALWEGTAEDDGDYYEGIYRCAFLLYCLGDAVDIPPLWRAKHINMDVGCSMGAEFFVGVGVHEAIAFTECANLPESNEIATYIRDWFSQPDAMQWQENWEKDMRSNINDA